MEYSSYTSSARTCLCLRLLASFAHDSLRRNMCSLYRDSHTTERIKSDSATHSRSEPSKPANTARTRKRAFLWRGGSDESMQVAAVVSSYFASTAKSRAAKEAASIKPSRRDTTGAHVPTASICYTIAPPFVSLPPRHRLRTNPREINRYIQYIRTNVEGVPGGLNNFLARR